MGPILHIHLLGNPQFCMGERPMPLPTPERSFALCAYLLLHRNHPLSRDHVSFLLWPDLSENDGRACLRRHLYLLRQQLLPSPGDHSWIVTNRSTVPESEPPHTPLLATAAAVPRPEVRWHSVAPLVLAALLIVLVALALAAAVPHFRRGGQPVLTSVSGPGAVVDTWLNYNSTIAPRARITAFIAAPPTVTQFGRKPDGGPKPVC